MGVSGTLQEGGVTHPLGQEETFLGGLPTEFLSESGYFWARRRCPPLVQTGQGEGFRCGSPAGVVLPRGLLSGTPQGVTMPGRWGQSAVSRGQRSGRSRSVGGWPQQ